MKGQVTLTYVEPCMCVVENYDAEAVPPQPALKDQTLLMKVMKIPVTVLMRKMIHHYP